MKRKSIMKGISLGLAAIMTAGLLAGCGSQPAVDYPEELIRYLMSEFESDPKRIWDSNMFGKSLSDLVEEGLSNKLMRMPEDVRGKIQETLQKIINEGSGGVICILL